MDIEAIVQKYAGDIRLFGDVMRAAAPQPQPKKEPRHD